MIRQATEKDGEALRSIYAYYVENTAITFECSVPSAGEFMDRMKRVLGVYPYFVAEINDEILGFACATPFNERGAYVYDVETTIYLRHDIQKQGLGRKLYGALEHALKLQGVVNLYACIALPDEDDEYLTDNSAKFHEPLGYKLAGTFRKCGYKFNRWYNMIWMEKQINEPAPSPPQIKRFDEIQHLLSL